ncbi:hypothetical protein [Streptomyces rimosus]|uniref:hypothetical protein n=1 Tax=Streptomyces rimosus TaxID=1927 RepID=UPI000A9E4A14|nr:hypothetical protein [Streptomyces rimosus]
MQLHYEAKEQRPKDEEDLDAVLPVLTGRQRRWLVAAITGTYGCHPWVRRLWE